MKCFECGKGNLRKQTAELEGERHGECFTVRMEALVCSKCGFRTIESARMGDYALRISDAYREKHGLLTSSQIKQRRRELGMSQEQFAKYLGVGSASVKRWELGQVQDEAMNRLMVLKTDAKAARQNAAEVARRLGLSRRIVA